MRASGRASRPAVARERADARLRAVRTLTAVIAGIGLVGLAGYDLDRRAKEIGIDAPRSSVSERCGAGLVRIPGFLYGHYAKLAAIAPIAAVPAAYVAVSTWLERFAYRIRRSPDLFILCGLATLLLVLATVTIRSPRAARTAPVNLLRLD